MQQLGIAANLHRDPSGIEQDDAFERTEELLADPTDELAGTGNANSKATLPPMTGAQATPNVDIGGVLDTRYAIEERLGQGGSALVMRARDLQGQSGLANRQVAVKTLRPELRFRPQSIARLQREFHQTRMLAHPNVVQHFNMGCDQGNWFIAMELLDGEALGQRLKAAPNGLPAPEALRIAAACGDALAHAHDKGVTHGDVKPDNVFVTHTKDVRVLDFGVAPDSVTTSPGAKPAERVNPAATRAYASPEVLSGMTPEPRDDVFSLACVIYEMLTGRHPYGRLGADEARDKGISIERVPGLATRQWQALSSGLAWSRADRPAHVHSLLRAMSPLPTAEMRPATVVPLPARVPLQQPRYRPSGRLQGRTVGLIALTALLSGLALFQSGDRAEPNTSVASAPMVGTLTGTRSADASSESSDDAPMAIAAVPLTETPRPAAQPSGRQVSFKTETMVVSRGTVSAAIPIQLEPGVSRVPVEWRAIDGSAVSGRDYGGPGSGVTVFQERQTDRILYVPIVNSTSATDDRSFTVELTGTSSARLGSPRRVRVTIAGAG